MLTTSSRKRAQTVTELKNDTFDLLVIGGGITEAGISLDATKRG